ncbi:DUF1800 domain-containing protein [uncultured Tateyamaria sp.]|uniref:DUF1800 domain-containing protein n=1 Tax=Tateyamaria sp. 1078 TaxID=3417464 RepID=UPI00262FDCBA|nr:DUF1800 domain-containing protein [uncultured Tateyamaria sp.]
MRAFDPELAEIRFGYGLSPHVAAPRDATAMLARLQGPDTMADTYPIEPFDTFRLRMIEVAKAAQIRRKNRGTPAAEAAKKRRNELNAAARKDGLTWAGHVLLRRIWTEDAFRERLVAFWSDHFTAHGKRGVIRRATSPYVQEAIRPHITGRFEDMLQAAVTHPLMLDYLDQSQSMGPGSQRAQSKKKNAGLNENLAREVLELHTLGVGGPYTQTDVRELAELFTGLSFAPEHGFVFRPKFAEPGPETVLGQTYADDATVGPVRAVLSDLAAHPATAAHLARKLAVHFVSDTPDPALVTALEAAYRDSGGTLIALYEVLLNHPSAWSTELSNIKPPQDFMCSALRSLAVPQDLLMRFGEKNMRLVFSAPLTRMGQEWQRPIGPDGWPEQDSHWITPQGLAGRVEWAMAAPEYILRVLPDPRRFVDDVLGARADDAVRFAAAAAESKSEAIGLVLMSPAFQRR